MARSEAEMFSVLSLLTEEEGNQKSWETIHISIVNFCMYDPLWKQPDFQECRYHATQWREQQRSSFSTSWDAWTPHRSWWSHTAWKDESQWCSVVFSRFLWFFTVNLCLPRRQNQEREMTTPPRHETCFQHQPSVCTRNISTCVCSNNS